MIKQNPLDIFIKLELGNFFVGVISQEIYFLCSPELTGVMSQLIGGKLNAYIANHTK